MKLRCKFCFSRCSSHADYVAHVEFSHVYTLNHSIICINAKCNEQFESTSELKAHYYRAHTNFHTPKNANFSTKLICPHCKERMPLLKKEMLSHLNVHIKESIFVDCPVEFCQSQFYSFASLNVHVYRHHNPWSDFNIKPHFFPPPEDKSSIDQTEEETMDVVEHAEPENYPPVEKNVKDSILNLTAKYEEKYKLTKEAVAEVRNDLLALVPSLGATKIEQIDCSDNAKSLDCKISSVPVETQTEISTQTDEEQPAGSGNLRSKPWSKKGIDFGSFFESLNFELQTEITKAEQRYENYVFEKELAKRTGSQPPEGDEYQYKHETSTVLSRTLVSFISRYLQSFGDYPSGTMIRDAVDSLLDRWPFLMLKVQGHYEQGPEIWYCRMREKLENERNKRRLQEAKNPSGDFQPPKKRGRFKKPLKGEINYTAPMTATQDISYQNLRDEFVKPEPDLEILDQKLEETYGMRRNDLIVLDIGVFEFVEKWKPIFSHQELMFREFLRATKREHPLKTLTQNLLVSAPVFKSLYLKGFIRAKREQKHLVMSFDTKEQTLFSICILAQDGVDLVMSTSEYSDLLEKEHSAVYCKSASKDLKFALVTPQIIKKEDATYCIKLKEVFLIDNLVGLLEAAACLISAYYILDLGYPKMKENSLWLLTWLLGVESANFCKNIQMKINIYESEKRKLALKNLLKA